MRVWGKGAGIREQGAGNKGSGDREQGIGGIEPMLLP